MVCSVDVMKAINLGFLLILWQTSVFYVNDHDKCADENAFIPPEAGQFQGFVPH